MPSCALNGGCESLPKIVTMPIDIIVGAWESVRASSSRVFLLLTADDHNGVPMWFII